MSSTEILLHPEFLKGPFPGGVGVLDLCLGIEVQPRKGIEWSLRALASMRAVRLFLRARAMIKYVLRAASTLKNTGGEQRALRKFSRRNLDLSLLQRNVLALSNLVGTVQPISAFYSKLCLVGDVVKLRQVASGAVH